MASPLGRSDFSRTIQDFTAAFTPPGWIYWDAELAAREHEEIFVKNWLCVGHTSRLASPGDYFLVTLGPESIILAADRAGTPHAFYNVCRHRGTRIVNESAGNCLSFRCPYHSWNYGLDGKLLGAPNMDGVRGFDKADFPLHSIRLEPFNGFLFINLDPGAKPIAEIYADFPDMTRFGTDELVRVGYHDYHVEANWKLICENYNECYHCQLAHPQLHRLAVDGDYPEYQHVGRHFTGGPMGIKPEFNTMTLPGVTERAPLPGILESDKGMVFYFNLYPTLLYSLAPDYVLTHYIWPKGPETCYIETEWFCAPDQIADASFDPADAIEFWDVTNRQDWALCENAMRGLKSRGHRPGRYQVGESCVHDFDHWYLQTMFGDGTPAR